MYTDDQFSQQQQPNGAANPLLTDFYSFQNNQTYQSIGPYESSSVDTYTPALSYPAHDLPELSPTILPARPLRAPKNFPRPNRSASPVDDSTPYCGAYSPELKTPPAPKGKDKGHNPFKCPRCKERFPRAKSVQDHFPSCIRRHGNPERLRWKDHHSCAKFQGKGPGRNRRKKQVMIDPRQVNPEADRWLATN